MERTARREQLRRVAWPLALGALVSLAFVPVFLRLVSDLSNTAYGYNDYGIHLELAATRFSWIPFAVALTHPVFHGLAALFAAVLGDDLGAVAALCLGAGGGAIVLYWIARRPHGSAQALPRGLAAGLALYLTLFETPVAALNALGWLDHPRTYANLHPWANPTDVVALPLTLLLVCAMVRAAASTSPGWFQPTRPRLLLALATVAGGLAKPAVLLALLPAFGLYTLLGGAGLRRRLATAVPWCAVPGVAVLVWQFWMIKTRPLAVEVGYDTYGIEFAPFRYVGFLGFGRDGPWLFWPSILWVALAAWAGGRDFWRHPPIRLSLCALPGVSVLAFLVSETGNQAADMNLIRTLAYALLPLICFSVVYLAQLVARRLREPPQHAGRPWWIPAAAVMAALWAVGGLFMYLDLIGVAEALSLHPTSVLPRLR